MSVDVPLRQIVFGPVATIHKTLYSGVVAFTQTVMKTVVGGMLLLICVAVFGQALWQINVVQPIGTAPDSWLHLGLNLVTSTMQLSAQTLQAHLFGITVFV